MKIVKINIDDHYQRVEMLKALHDNGYEAKVVKSGKVAENAGIYFIEVEVPDTAVRSSNELSHD